MYCSYFSFLWICFSLWGLWEVREIDSRSRKDEMSLSLREGLRSDRVSRSRGGTSGAESGSDSGAGLFGEASRPLLNGSMLAKIYKALHEELSYFRTEFINLYPVMYIK